MKILHVVPSLDPSYGGPTTAALGLSSALARQGQDVEIVTTNAGVRGKLSVPLGKPVILRNVSVTYFSHQYFRNFKISLPLAGALKKRIPRFDIVHIHSLFQFSTLAACHYCRHYKKPYIICTLGQLDAYALKRKFLRKKTYLRLFENRNLKNASALHFATEDERNHLADPSLKNRGVVVSLGLDFDEFTNLPETGSFRTRYPLLGKKKIILFFGRVNFKKGLDILVSAFARIVAKRDEVILVIAGPDNESYGRKVKSWLHTRGIAGRVLFTGMLLDKDKLAVLRDSDIFVLPSYSESFGLAVIEAMACGLPVVISDRVGIFKEIMAARAGSIVACEEEKLTDALTHLLDNPGLRREMGENGRRLVQDQFTWDAAAQRMLRCYQDVLHYSR